MKESFGEPHRQGEEKLFLTPEIRETLKRLALVCILALGTETGPGVNTARTQDLKPPTATAENIEGQRERNLKALRPGEYLVPESVMSVFNEVYANTLRGLLKETTSGYFVEESSLKFLLARKSKFDEKIREMGLSEEEMRKTEEMFKAGNIFFGERAALSPNFTEFLWHERIHKYMEEDLSPEERESLSEVKRILIDDYFKSNKTVGPIKKGAEGKFSAEIAALLKQAPGMPLAEYERMKREIIEKYHEPKERTEPILKADNPSAFAEFQLYYMVYSKRDEFWNTLVLGNFTNVEKYIEKYFPGAYVVFKRMEVKAKTETK